VDYVYDLTIPANTKEDDATEIVVRLPYGIVSGVRLLFPTGCAGLARARILVAQHQVWPSNPETWYNGNGTQIAFDADLLLESDLNTVTLQGYNSDDTYPHTVTISLTVIAPVSVLDQLRGPGTWEQI